MQVENSAMAIVVAKNDERWQRVLLLNNDENEWVFPKGRLEPGEPDVDAALRELEEEAGVRLLHANYLTQLNSIAFWFAPRNVTKVVSVHLFVVRAAVEAVPNIAEGFVEARWMTPMDALRRLTHDDARQRLAEALRAIES